MTAFHITHLKKALHVAPLVAALALAGCEDPKPGLVNPEREAVLDRCDVKLKRLASTDEQLTKLCDCTTARLAQQGFSLGALENENRDRAMEQVRWCMTQVGAVPLGTPAKVSEPEVDAPDDKAEEAAVEPAE